MWQYPLDEPPNQFGLRLHILPAWVNDRAPRAKAQVRVEVLLSANAACEGFGLVFHPRVFVAAREFRGQLTEALFRVREGPFLFSEVKRLSYGVVGHFMSKHTGT